ncbi:MAG: NAD(P)H-dependent glycerol-3-phosphate dehydrogenase [Brachymonas sp.]|nr:NAD(P)H-dependent glycerol-3-phosphate dehydrogenase [Brachymonas sp.]
MKIAVLGAGAWGTGMALQLARRHVVHLWAREPEVAAAMQQNRVNERYLPGISFPDSVHVHAGTAQAADVADSDLVLLACPVAGLRHQLVALRHVQQPVVWLCKGFEAVQPGADYGLLPHEVMAQVAPELQAGVLSGPSFAQEVARNQPTAMVVASPHERVCQTTVQAVHGGMVRLYTSSDWVGVEVGGAVKNVMAIAAGVLDGLAERAAATAASTGAASEAALACPGLNARAALLTRGLAEMTRFGRALGAEEKTFMGLSGMGDLVLTATGDLSRNRRVGLLLAQGLTAQQAVDTLGHVAEGVYCARTVLARAEALHIDMPITRCVVALLDGQLTATQAAHQLMGRDARAENDR